MSHNYRGHFGTQVVSLYTSFSKRTISPPVLTSIFRMDHVFKTFTFRKRREQLESLP
jgi:hypothetical protein